MWFERAIDGLGRVVDGLGRLRRGLGQDLQHKDNRREHIWCEGWNCSGCVEQTLKIPNFCVRTISGEQLTDLAITSRIGTGLTAQEQ